MGAIRTMAFVPLALLALACSKQTQPRSTTTALGDDLRSDLERAAAPTSDLASTRFRPTDVVSNIELGTAPASRGAPQPRKQKVHRVTPSPAPRVAQVKAVAVEPAPAPAPEPTVVAAAPAPQPTAGPRPTPNPVEMPAGQGSSSGGDQGGGIGPAIGGVIGVIIRGGGIGDGDHCEIHRPGAGPMINHRFPTPIGRTTFPMRGGW